MKSIIIYLIIFSLTPWVNAQVEDDLIPVIPSGKSIGTVYLKVDIEPSFPDGDKGLLKFYKMNSKYPIVEDEKHGLTVYYQLIIDEEGQVIDYKLLKGQDEELNIMTKELVFKMPKWKPGYLNNQAVKVRKNLSITYSYNYKE